METEAEKAKRRKDTYKTYRLWVGYLKQSPGYRAYCERVREYIKLNNRIPRPEELNGGSKEVDNFNMFGDIHEPGYKFITWYRGFEQILNSLWVPDCELIKDYSELVREHIQSCSLDVTRNPRGKKISSVPDFLTELEDRVEERIKNDMKRGMIYLGVNVVSVPVDELVSVFKKEVRRARSNPLVKQARLSGRKYLLPISGKKLPLDELRRYLKRYDKLKNQHKKAREIVGKGDDVRREFWKDIEKATIIIENVEKGEFPGFYGSSTE